MEWPLVALIMGIIISLLSFVWGIIKIFKKPIVDLTWKEHYTTLKTKIEDLNQKIINHGNKIHDLETYKDVITKNIDELKGEMNKVSGKCDKILDKVIEYMSKE
jgi:uncharacterized coiled-coil DUF342 family protein